MGYFDDYFGQTFELLKEFKNAIGLDDISFFKSSPNFNETLTFRILNGNKSTDFDFSKFNKRDTDESYKNNINIIRRQKVLGFYDNIVSKEEKDSMLSCTPDNTVTDKLPNIKKGRTLYSWI